MLEFNYYVVQLRPFTPKVLAGFVSFSDSADYLFRLKEQIGDCIWNSTNTIETPDGSLFKLIHMTDLELLRKNKLEI